MSRSDTQHLTRGAASHASIMITHAHYCSSSWHRKEHACTQHQRHGATCHAKPGARTHLEADMHVPGFCCACGLLSCLNCLRHLRVSEMALARVSAFFCVSAKLNGHSVDVGCEHAAGPDACCLDESWASWVC